MSSNFGIYEAIRRIYERLDRLEYDVELIKAELNIQDTEESKQEKEHHIELLHNERQEAASEKGGCVLGIIIGIMMFALFIGLSISPHP